MYYKFRNPVRTRGRVFKRNGIWHMEVKLRGVIVDADNGGTRESMIEQARVSVSAFEYVSWVGHSIKKSFPELAGWY